MVFLQGERLPYGIISGGGGAQGEEFSCDTGATYTHIYIYYLYNYKDKIQNFTQIVECQEKNTNYKTTSETNITIIKSSTVIISPNGFCIIYFKISNTI